MVQLLEKLHKAELYERAKKRGIKGRSTMNKQQLVAALRPRKRKQKGGSPPEADLPTNFGDLPRELQVHILAKMDPFTANRHATTSTGFKAIIEDLMPSYYEKNMPHLWSLIQNIFREFDKEDAKTFIPMHMEIRMSFIADAYFLRIYNYKEPQKGDYDGIREPGRFYNLTKLDKKAKNTSYRLEINRAENGVEEQQHRDKENALAINFILNHLKLEVWNKSKGDDILVRINMVREDHSSDCMQFELTRNGPELKIMEEDEDEDIPPDDLCRAKDDKKQMLYGAIKEVIDAMSFRA